MPPRIRVLRRSLPAVLIALAYAYWLPKVSPRPGMIAIHAHPIGRQYHPTQPVGQDADTARRECKSNRYRGYLMVFD